NENVGAFDQLERKSEAVCRAQIDGDGAFIAIVELERRTDARVGIAHRARDEAANRVACGRVFELDNVGAPIAEHGGGGGAGDPHRDFDDLYSLQWTVHRNLILMKPAVGFILPWAGVTPAPSVNKFAARGVLRPRAAFR